MKKILFICPYPQGLAPSQRFRFEQYISQLEEKGFHLSIKPFFEEKAYYAFYQSGNLISKIHSITRSYFKRLALLFQLSSFHYIFIHREATPLGPPIIEYAIAKVFGKKIIYDFDDAIWLTDKTNESALTEMLRCRRKVRAICKWSYKVSCGNSYLAAYARQYNLNVMINPTTIDDFELHVSRQSHEGSNHKVTIGWTGSHSTLKYLGTLIPVLQSLEKRYPQVHWFVIADRDPNLSLKNYAFRRWRKETEISDLHEFDIGIMPLPDDAWTRGKCGFKALQYMAMSIPAVISPVGVNKEIVQHGNEGYCCTSYDEWFIHLEDLILHPEKRATMGKKGRRKVINSYSVSSNSSNFLSLFQ